MQPSFAAFSSYLDDSRQRSRNSHSSSQPPPHKSSVSSEVRSEVRSGEDNDGEEEEGSALDMLLVARTLWAVKDSDSDSGGGDGGGGGVVSKQVWEMARGGEGGSGSGKEGKDDDEDVNDAAPGKKKTTTRRVCTTANTNTATATATPTIATTTSALSSFADFIASNQATAALLPPGSTAQEVIVVAVPHNWPFSSSRKH